MKQLLLKLKDLLDSIVDKVAHYGYGLTVSMIMSFLVFNDIWGYIGIIAMAFMAGVFKEAFDVVCGKTINWKDIWATTIGGVVFSIYWYLTK
jgi:hypothetical protein